MITDALRKEVFYAPMEPDQRGRFNAIADRIDAEHAEAQRRWMAELDAAREQSFNAGFDDGFASADDWLAQHEDAMREHGWIRLPKDADGEPIHIGDVMKGEKIGGGFCEPFEVVGYIMSNDIMGNGELEPMDEHKCPRSHKYLHHHKQLTVEDVLEQFAVEVERAGGAFEVADDVWTRFAAKLRLAESEDE